MNPVRTLFAAAAAILLISAAATTASAQKFPIIIADSVNKWSEATTARIQDAKNNKLATVDVFVKVKKFKGTTGECVVFFRNTGNTTISAWGGLQTGDKPASQSIYEVNAGKFTLKPGQEVSFNLELRECWPKNRKGLDAAGKCAACAPNICFANVRID